MTNFYAKQKLFSYTASSDDLIRFFGIILFSGYHQVPKEDHCWSTSEDLSNNIVEKISKHKAKAKVSKHKKLFLLSWQFESDRR